MATIIYVKTIAAIAAGFLAGQAAVDKQAGEAGQLLIVESLDRLGIDRVGTEAEVDIEIVGQRLEYRPAVVSPTIIYATDSVQLGMRN